MIQPRRAMILSRAKRPPPPIGAHDVNCPGETEGRCARIPTTLKSYRPGGFPGLTRNAYLMPHRRCRFETRAPAWHSAVHLGGRKRDNGGIERNA